MVIALTHHCFKPSSSNSPSSPSAPDRMSSKPGSGQRHNVKKTYTVSGRTDTTTARTDITPLTSRGVPAKSLPKLSPESPRALEGKRARRVVLRRASEGSCSGSSRLSTVVELPGINTVTRRHSVAGTASTIDESHLEVFVSPPLKRCSSFSDATAAHAARSSFRTRERPHLMRRSGPGTTPIPPTSRRSSHPNSPVEVNNNRPIVKTSYGGSRHFELTLQKIEETKPHLENGFPSRSTRKVVQRKNAVSSMDGQYLGGLDYQEFRNSMEGRRYASISEMKPEYAQELLTHNEEDIGLQEETEDEQLRQKCLKWLETLPQK